MGMTQLAEELFTGTGALDANWTVRINNVTRANDHGSGSTGGQTNQADYTGVTFKNDQYAEAETYSLNPGTRYINVSVRGSPGATDWNGYVATSDGGSGGNNTGIIVFDDETTGTWLVDFVQSFGSTDRIRITVVGDSISLWRSNDSGVSYRLLAVVNDATHTSGDAGCGTWGSGETLDNFRAGNFVHNFPYIHSYTENNTAGSTVTSVTLTKPSGVVAGDLLLMIGYSDANNVGEWNDISSPDLWTTEYDVNFSAADANLGIWSRVADGTEASTQAISGSASLERGGWYICIKNVHPTAPINVKGTASSGSGTAHIVSGVTTTAINCLALAALAFDGGDGFPFVASSSSWGLIEEGGQSGTGGNDASGCWATKEVPAAGVVSALTLVSSASDGSSEVMFAIAPPPGGIITKPSVMSSFLTKR